MVTSINPPFVHVSISRPRKSTSLVWRMGCSFGLWSSHGLSGEGAGGGKVILSMPFSFKNNLPSCSVTVEEVNDDNLQAELTVRMPVWTTASSVLTFRSSRGVSGWACELSGIKYVI